VSRSGSERDGSHATVGSAKLGVDITPDFNIEGTVRHTDRGVQTDSQSFLTGLLADANNRSDYNSTAARIGATFSMFGGHWVQSINGKYFAEQSRGISGGGVTSGADGQRSNFETKSVFTFDSNMFGGEKHTAVVLYDHRNEHYKQAVGTLSFDKYRDSLAGEYILDLPTATTLSGALRQDWNSVFANAVTWRGAVSQRIPVTMSRLHASIGKGVTDPDVFQLFGSSFNLANPGLTPEQSVGWDTGLEQKLWNGRIVTDVTYFSTNFENKIELNAIAGGGFIYRNGTGEANRRGIEVSQTISWADWLSTTAIYTYTDALDSAGMREVRRPLHSGAFEVTASTPDKRTKASARVAINGERVDLFFGPTGPPRVMLPSYTLVRGTVSHDVTPWSTVYVRAENIFNTQYEDVLSFRAPGFAIFAGLKVHTVD
jgi:vitamin B12 transporter